MSNDPTTEQMRDALREIALAGPDGEAKTRYLARLPDMPTEEIEARYRWAAGTLGMMAPAAEIAERWG